MIGFLCRFLVAFVFSSSALAQSYPAKPIRIVVPLHEVPTAAEAGVKGYSSAAWFAFLAPRATPRPVVDKLYREVAAAMADPAVRSRFSEFGAEPLATTPEELGRHISAEIAKWREIISKAGIALDP